MTFATLRLIQQSYWSHVLVAAFLAGLTAYLTASPSMALSAGITAFVLSIQHSPGSASFKDGSPNTAVNNVVKIQAAAADGHPEVKSALASISSQASAVAAQVTK